MPGRAGPLRRILLLLVLLAGPAIVLVAWIASGSSDTATPTLTRPVPSVTAEGLERRTIYESPQDPGYTAWVGAWLMPDDELMVGFVQATGSVDPTGREAAPPRVLEAMDVGEPEPERDFWGLDLSTEYLRSSDGGRSWRAARSDGFQALGPYAYTAQPVIALEDGTLVRRVNGDDLRDDPELPHTAFLQRLAPGADEWGPPQVLMDPARHTYQVSRLRYLRDGRLIATGNVWDVPAGTPRAERAEVPSRYLLMVSSDDGETWRDGLEIDPATGPLPGNEWDTAELPNGGMAAVMRTLDPETGEQIRKHGLLEESGDGWLLTDVRDAPFPHSGHPELLATRAGPVLHISTEGVHSTKDGRTWTPLRFPPGVEYRSNYYPRALQTDDGVVRVFSHIGGDDAYGERDQAITMDSFRLRTRQP